MARPCKIDEIKIEEKKRFRVEGKEILMIRLEDVFTPLRTDVLTLVAGRPSTES